MAMLADQNVREMIDDCLNVLTIPKQNGGPGFNKWEVGFVKSLDEQFNRNMGFYNSHGFSDKQLEKLEQIWNKI